MKKVFGDNLTVEWGKKLKSLRDKAGISQQALADAGVSSLSYVRSVEAGKRSPTISALELLLTPLGVTLPEFFESRVPLKITDPKYRVLCEKLMAILEAGGSYEEGIVLNIDAIFEKMQREATKRKKPSAEDKRHTA